MCFEAQDWKMLNEQVMLFSKKRGQLKQAIAKMVQEAMVFIEQTPSMEVKLALIDTLLQVTEGKIYVEIEGARLTKLLAKIREDEGKIAEAADILQRLQVETFGSMERREKVDFILEQMRLLVAKKDYIRTQLVSKKINTKFFEKEENAVRLLLRHSCSLFCYFILIIPSSKIGPQAQVLQAHDPVRCKRGALPRCVQVLLRDLQHQDRPGV